MTENPRSYAGLKHRISLLAVIAAGIACLIAFLVKGVQLDFVYGLALGTAVSIANFHVLAYFVKQTYERGGSIGLSFTGYLIRLPLYAVAVLTAAKTGNTSLLGTILGFVTIQFGIYVDSFIGRNGSWN